MSLSISSQAAALPVNDGPQIPGSLNQESSFLSETAQQEATSEDPEPLQDLSASYKNTTHFFDCNLGLALTSNSIEVHILNKDNTAVIEKIKLSGKRFARRSVKTPFGQVSIEKPRRGELMFRHGSTGVQYKSIARVGGVNISINVGNLEKCGQFKRGASNFEQSLSMFFARTPSDAVEIESWRKSMLDCSYRQEGLKDPETIREFCSLMKDLYNSWSLLEPMQRILEIRQISNKCLMQAGVYPCHFPEKQIDKWEKFCSDSLCHFVALDWSIYRSPDFVDRHILTKQEELAFAQDLYRELRRAEHSWLLMRNAAGFEIGIASCPKFSGKQISKIFAIASENGIKSPNAQPLLRQQLLGSYQAIDLKSIYATAIEAQKPRQNRIQKLLGRFGIFKFFPSTDASECARHVKQHWNDC